MRDISGKVSKNCQELKVKNTTKSKFCVNILFQNADIKIIVIEIFNFPLCRLNKLVANNLAFPVFKMRNEYSYN